MSGDKRPSTIKVGGRIHIQEPECGRKIVRNLEPTGLDKVLDGKDCKRLLEMRRSRPKCRETAIVADLEFRFQREQCGALKNTRKRLREAIRGGNGNRRVSRAPVFHQYRNERRRQERHVDRKKSGVFGGSRSQGYTYSAERAKSRVIE